MEQPVEDLSGAPNDALPTSEDLFISAGKWPARTLEPAKFAVLGANHLLLLWFLLLS